MTAGSGVSREEWREQRAFVLMLAPCLAAFTAFWLPMFRARAPEQGPPERVAADTWTLLGVGLDPGSGGLQTVIRVLALLTLVLLAVCIYAAVAPFGTPSGPRPARWVSWVALAAMISGSVLWLVTVQGDGVGRFGTDTVQPVGGSWLLFILPLWFLAAHDAVKRL